MSTAGASVKIENAVNPTTPRTLLLATLLLSVGAPLGALERREFGNGLLESIAYSNRLQPPDLVSQREPQAKAAGASTRRSAAMSPPE